MMYRRNGEHQTRTDWEKNFATLLRDARRSLRARGTTRESSSAQGLADATDAEYTDIRQALVPTDGGLNLRTLERHFQLRERIDGVGHAESLALIDILKDATRQSGWTVPPFSSGAAWTRGLAGALRYKHRKGGLGTTTSERVSILADAAKTLRAHGYPVNIVEGELSITSWEPTLLTWIDKAVARLGGEAVAEKVFNGLSEAYDASMDRYHIHRNPSTYPRGGVTAPIPSGFLLAMSAKYLDVVPTAEDNALLEQVVALATAYAACHDLIPVSHWEILNRTTQNLALLLREVAAFDTLYQIRQLPLSHAARLVRGLFGWVADDVARATLGCTVSELAALVDAVSARLEGVRGPAVISASDVLASSAEPRMDLSAVTSVLQAYSHAQRTNVAFISPLDTQSQDDWKRPLWPCITGFAVLDARASGPAFVEATADLLRPKDGQTDQRIGESFEQLVHEELSKRGIVTRKGKYKASTGSGECDAIVECDDAVIFLELKNKSLTRKARAADAWHIIRDLRQGLIDPQLQLGRHEIALLTDGFIALPDGRLELNGRSTERVALSPLDFGAFHSRDIAIQTLDLLAGCSLTAPDAPQTEVDAVNRKLAALGRQWQILNTLSLQHQKMRRHLNCWFLGAPQLLTMLSQCSSNVSFWNELKRTRHISYGTLSWHFEYKQALELAARNPILPQKAEEMNTTMVLG
jgi:hypothetical protein